ncbi:hypothetical protein J6590_083719, partial [Homalodisca vitripennis]
MGMFGIYRYCSALPPLFLSACHDHPIEHKREELVTVARLQRAGNNLPITVDLFHDGVRSLKWKVKGAVLPT